MVIGYPSLKLGNRIISKFSKPYLIAEVGVNHEGSLARAQSLIAQAAAAGASAVKFQTYSASSLAIPDSPTYWDPQSEPSETQFALFSRFAEFDAAQYEELARYCTNCGVDFASTPFDESAVDLLDPLVSYFKIASADITYSSLLKHVASKGKPVLLSTGASTEDEIGWAIELLLSNGATAVCIMHCVLSYPTPIHEARLASIGRLQNIFPEHVIGYSDHTLAEFGPEVLSLAYALGARVIETHFTDDKMAHGNDHYHALDETDLRITRNSIERTAMIMGEEGQRLPSEVEGLSRKFARRSVVARQDIAVGTILSAADLTAKRPGTGLDPRNLSALLGRKTAKRVLKNQMLQFDDLESE